MTDNFDKSIDLVEDLIRAVQTLQGMCGWEPPEGGEHADWLGCEMIVNSAKSFIEELPQVPSDACNCVRCTTSRAALRDHYGKGTP